MSIGRSFAFQRGKVSLGGSMVATNWKGALVLRNRPSTVWHGSNIQIKLNSALRYFAVRWRNLTEIQRAKWEAYIKMAGHCAKQWESHEVTGDNLVVRKRRFLMSGFNAYLRSNLLAYTSGMDYPRDEAPLQQAGAPIPTNLSLSYGNGVATIEVDAPYFGCPFSEARLRFHARLFSHKDGKDWRIDRQVVGILPITREAEPGERTQFTFTHLRGGRRYKNQMVSLTSLPNARIEAQTDVVMTYGREIGVWVGAASNIDIKTIINVPDNVPKPEPLVIKGLNA